jgi:hypothetical protein
VLSRRLSTVEGVPVPRLTQDDAAKVAQLCAGPWTVAASPHPGGLDDRDVLGEHQPPAQEENRSSGEPSLTCRGC